MWLDLAVRLFDDLGEMSLPHPVRRPARRTNSCHRHSLVRYGLRIFLPPLRLAKPATNQPFTTPLPRRRAKMNLLQKLPSQQLSDVPFRSDKSCFARKVLFPKFRDCLAPPHPCRFFRQNWRRFEIRAVCKQVEQPHRDGKIGVVQFHQKHRTLEKLLPSCVSELAFLEF